MNIFDIIGPVMVGPSSSHTAGAVRIGYISRRLMNGKIVEANIGLHGSFDLTGRGHGTDRALVAGLLGMQPDDIRIPNSLSIAAEKGLKVSFFSVDLGDVHPNSVVLKLVGPKNRKLEVLACSIGGGRIHISKIDGLSANFSGDYPTLVVHNQDEPGHVAEVTSMLAHKCVNIATMQLFRKERAGSAVMVIECDQEIPAESIRWLEHLDGVSKVTYLSLQDPVDPQSGEESGKDSGARSSLAERSFL